MGGKLCTSREAVERYIKPGSTLVVSGFQTATMPQQTLEALAQCFDETGNPRDLTVIAGTTPGIDIIAKEGLLKRIIAGSYLFSPKTAELVAANVVEGYNLPQSVICHQFRQVCNKIAGLPTQVGEGTFVDPRLGGGKLNASATDDLVELRQIMGQEQLFYLSPHVDVTILRATSCDEDGNASFANEYSYSFAVEAAMAAKACGGVVIVECRDYVKKDTLSAMDVKLSHVFVDAVVKIEDQQTHYKVSQRSGFNRVVLGQSRTALNPGRQLPSSPQKVIARRAALMLAEGQTVFVGAGVAAGVSDIVGEEGCASKVVIASESGANGGVFQDGEPFGVQANFTSLLDEPGEYDFLHSGVLDTAFLTFMQADASGKVNSSAAGGFIAGCGPTIDAACSARTIVFCGLFAADGRRPAFVGDVEQITVDAARELARGAAVYAVTDRAVFELTGDGWLLCEIAPGMDLQKDVLDLMSFAPAVAPEMATMPACVFDPQPMGLLA